MTKRICVTTIILLPLMSVILSGCRTEKAEISNAPVVNSQGIAEEKIPVKESKIVDKVSVPEPHKETVDVDTVIPVEEDINVEEIEFIPEDVYEIIVAFDEKTHIQRTTWDFGKYKHTLYYEIPVFPQNGISYNKINAYFDALNQSFIEYQESEYGSLSTILAQIENPIYEDIYCDANRTEIFVDTENLIGVRTFYEWYMGGVSDYGSDTYYFDTQTGKALTINNFLINSEVEIKEMLCEELQKTTEYSDDIFWDIVEEYPISELDFEINNGNFIISFDKYEIATGVMGEIEITLPVTFNETYGQELANMEDLT